MIRLENVTKVFGTGSTALSDITLTIDPGEFVFLVGPSGSGKSTLLRMLIREVIPTSGTIQVNEINLTKLPNNKVPHLRRNIGVVFQDLKLLVDRTIFENIILPLEMSNVPHNEAKDMVHKILDQVGISDHTEKYPVQLSGGELQRAAIARALIFSPKILLADEPTGNLDTATSWEILKLLQDINKTGTTVIMATHNIDIVNSLLKRVIALEKGTVMKDTKEKNSTEKKPEEKNEDDKTEKEKSSEKKPEEPKEHEKRGEEKHEEKESKGDKTTEKEEQKGEGKS